MLSSITELCSEKKAPGQVRALLGLTTHKVDHSLLQTEGVQEERGVGNVVADNRRIPNTILAACCSQRWNGAVQMWLIHSPYGRLHLVDTLDIALIQL